MEKNPIRLEPETIVFPPTYITSVSKLAAKIINEEDSVLRYEWRLYATEKEEKEAIASLDLSNPIERNKLEDILLFQSDIFSFDPIKSEIWSHRYQQFVCTYTPLVARNYEITAYLYNLDTHERIPFVIRGVGLPAAATFNTQQINLGHVALESVNEYQIILRNTGLVELDYQYRKKTTKNIKFSFTPESGHLKIGESVPIIIRFEANYVGQFNESFTYEILGVESGHPTIAVAGRVIGPTFQITKKSIDFGNVSFGFLYTESFDIINKTDIPFEFNFKMIIDHTFDAREFKIIPSNGTIQKFGRQTINVEFIPIAIQHYKVELCMEADKFDDILFRMPMTGICLCPEISIENPELDLGSVFIDYEYETSVTMIDDTSFPAKFEFLDSSDSSTLEASVVFPKARGIIGAHHQTPLPIKIRPLQLGYLKLLRYVRIFGSDAPPIPFTIIALCTGPNINISQSSIDYGAINVLNDNTQELLLKNDSLIPAPFQGEVTGATVFRIEPTEGVIAPGDTQIIRVIANLDDTIGFSGKVIFNFKNLAPIQVDLKAKGTGTAIVSSINMEAIELGYVFTVEPAVHKFRLDNKGRRPQEIKWSQQKPKIENFTTKPNFSYKVIPDTQMLNPREGADFQIIFECNGPCSFTLSPQCHTTLDRQRLDLYHPVITGTFIRPMLRFEKDRLDFIYKHDVDKEEELTGNIKTHDLIAPSQSLLTNIEQVNVVTNYSELPLVFNADVKEPFSMSITNFELQPSETKEFTVTFDPHFKTNFASEYIDKQVTFSFVDNPHKYFLNLHASLIFPNLSFSPSGMINFGILLIHTEETRDVRITNTSEVTASFVWELANPATTNENEHIFDISPIRGEVEAGKSADIHFNFFAGGGSEGKTSGHFSNVAVCHLIGGPEYTIPLKGSSAAINYSIEPTCIEYGQRFYKDLIADTITLKNMSDVQISYSVKIPKRMGLSYFSINPQNGIAGSGEEVIFQFQLIPGLPKKYNASFLIQIGHFDDVQVDLNFDCYCPQLSFSIPRHPEDTIQSQIRLKSPVTATNGHNHEVTLDNNQDSKFLEMERKLIVERLAELPHLTPLSLKKAKAKKISTISKFHGFVASKYLIDFGDIVLGETKSFEYEFTSRSPSPVSIEILNSSLNASGFSISPTSFRDIPPGEKIQISCTFETSKNTKNIIGNSEISVPVIFNDEIGYSLVFKANIIMPTLIFSKMHFNFDTTILGQTRVLTLQLQNMNPVGVEFNFHEAQALNMIQRTISAKEIPVFSATPSSGYLPPASFVNIDIAFHPNSEKTFTMQFPIDIKYNTETFFVSLKGNGVQMKIHFEPSDIVFPPIQPFCDASQVEVDLVNPCSYPIEVFAYQYDFQLLCNQLTKRFEESLLTETDTQVVSFSPPSANSVSKFSLCVIVHGAMQSGKTRISNEIAKYIGGVPIIDLKEVWAGLIDNNNATPEEFTKIVVNIIQSPDYVNGFVIDGLDALKELPENEQFLIKFLKQKGTPEEIQRNPFTVLTDPYVSAYERALSYLLDALDAQYVFLVGLNANEQVLYSHQNSNEVEQKKKRVEQHKKEMEKLFEMDEDDYIALTDEERQEVDEKREYYRQYMIEHDGDLSDFITKEEAETKKAHESKSGTNKNRRPTRGRTLIPTDPLIQSVLQFQYTFGRLAAQIKESTDKFQVIDPLNIINEGQRRPAPVPETFEKEGSKTQNKKNQEEAPTPQSMASLNSIIINAMDTVEEVMEEISCFLPQISTLKEKAFTKLIPAPRLLMPDVTSVGAPQLHQPPPCFSIVNVEPPGEFPVFTKPVTSSPSSKAKKTREERDDSLTDGLDPMNYTKRWSIEPGSSVRLRLEFNSTCPGDFIDNLLFGIVDCQNDVFKLKVRGVCSLPNFDRSIMSVFPRCCPKVYPKLSYAYVQTLSEFHFGTLLIAKERSGRNAQPAYKTTLRLINDGKFPATVSSELQVCGNKTVWTIENANQSIEPGQVGTVVIGFHPTVVDQYRNRLTITVKDNPEPLLINIVAEGSSPMVEVSTTNLDFEKLLLKQVRTKKLVLKNPGNLPAFWRFKAINQLGGLFQFSATEGHLQGKSSTTIEITYSSQKPIVIKKMMQLDILDQNKTRTFFNHHINFAAESFEVSYDLVFPKGMEHLQFGVMKVDSQKVLSCVLKNKSKYSSLFKVFTAKDTASNLFKITPAEGSIPPGDKGVTLNFSVTPTTVVKKNNSKGISVRISDSINQITAATIVIPFSVESVYSSYKIEPENKLDFGPLSISATMSKEITLMNTGPFPFEYEISPKIEVAPPTNTPRGKNARKKPAPRPTPQGKGKPPRGKNGKDSFQIGNFVVSNSSGVVQPNASQPISISFNSSVAGPYDSTIIIKISDSDPANNPEGFPFQLHAESFVPGITTDDYEKVFPGQHLCLRCDVLKGETRAFLEDEQIFHFAPAVLKEISTIDVALVNPLPIPCTVDCLVKPRSKQNAKSFPFELNEKTITIEGNSSVPVKLTFCPLSCDKFTGSFEATVRGGLNTSMKLLKFGIEGVGTLPSIKIQGFDPKMKALQIPFGKTLIGYTKEKDVIIKNTGLIPAYLTIQASATPDFSLAALDKVHEFPLAVDNKFSLPVKYCPETTRKGQFEVTISVRDNAAMNATIIFSGEGFSDDVIFEGCGDDNDIIFKDNVVGRQQQVTFLMRNVCQDDARFMWTNHPDFTFCPRVGQLRKGQNKEITVTFFSDKPVKYNGQKVTCNWSKIDLHNPEAPDWDDSMKLVKFVQRSSLAPALSIPSSPADERPKGTPRRFPGAANKSGGSKRASKLMPSKGGRSQDIEPLIPQQVVFQSPKGPEHDLVKVIEIKEEPPYDVQTGKQKELNMKVFAVSDFIKYQISVTEIEFAPTMMFETRVANCKVTNISSIRFEYSWLTTKFGSLRTDYAQTRPSPFSVEPKSGYIEAGQSTIFKVKFSPEEVDDFTAHLRCEIPFLSQMDPPQLYVTGRSKRPLCHFNLEMSDYLSAGRRHPDYTDPLPEGVKVIELFSKGIGFRTTNKFEIINATSAPYEINWTQVGIIDSKNSPVTCDIPRALISSGKRHTASFSYTPVSVKTVESLWQFHIPEHGIKVYLLIVGRIMPH